MGLLAQNRKVLNITCKPWPGSDRELRAAWAWFRSQDYAKGPFNRSACIRLCVKAALDIRDAQRKRDAT